jgi:hypothetical protein
MSPEITLFAFWISTTLFNAYATIAIGYRALPLLRSINSPPKDTQIHVNETRIGASVLLLLESGALYTIVGLVFLYLSTKSVIHGAEMNVKQASFIYKVSWEILPVRAPYIPSGPYILISRPRFLVPHLSSSERRLVFQPRQIAIKRTTFRLCEMWRKELHKGLVGVLPKTTPTLQ